jgi:hypothetical protein
MLYMKSEDNASTPISSINGAMGSNTLANLVLFGLFDEIAVSIFRYVKLKYLSLK